MPQPSTSDSNTHDDPRKQPGVPDHELAGTDSDAASSDAPDNAAQCRILWARVQSNLAASIQREQFDTWFRRAELRSLDDKRVVLAIQNGFTRDFIESYYAEKLTRAVETALGSPRKVDYEVDEYLTTPANFDSGTLYEDEAPAASPTSTDVAGDALETAHEPQSKEVPSQPHPSPAQQLDGDAALAVPPDVRKSAPSPAAVMAASDVGLNPKNRFDAFVVGPCNRFAHAAAMGVSELPGDQYNPFFMHGNVGLGKTHLMQSLCHSLLERNPNTKILYLSCETFVNHFVSALQNGDIQTFRNKYRNVDVLVVDDIHLIANKERTQEEFFHTFNTLYNAGKQIVLSSDSTPKDIPSLQERLVSRFKWGLVTEIQAPCIETRMAILKAKARERGHELDDDIAALIAEKVRNNIRELEGAVTRLIGYAKLSDQPLSKSLARDALADLFETSSHQPTMEDILRVVTQRFGVKAADLQSRRRTASIAYARQIGMFLARRVTRLSLEEVGGFFGGRDHTTVLYAVNKIDGLIKKDAEVLETVRDLESQLGSTQRQI